MSPVLVNVQKEDWAPRPSTATVENGDGYDRRESQDSSPNVQELFKSRMPVTQDIPFRLSYDTSSAAPQVAPFSSGESSVSRNLLEEFQRNRGHNVDENGNNMEVQPVPQLQYHHQSRSSDGGSSQSRGNSNGLPNDLVDAGSSINRHLTPTAHVGRRTPIQRPHSTFSDMGSRGRTPGLPGSPMYGGRAPSANSSSRSNDVRPYSYIDLANMSYPQAPPHISMDNSQLRSAVGTNASLLSMAKTLEMYRQNVKKLNDSETQYAFAIFLVQAAQDVGVHQENDTLAHQSSQKPGNRDLDSPYIDQAIPSPQELLSEAKQLLQKLSDRSYPFAQYYLADGYASGLFSKGKEDYGTAFPLFVAASKRGHAESGYRAALCYEFGWGCRSDPAKAIQFYRQSASKSHPGAMTRLGRACLIGDLGPKQYREGLKWLKRATESADIQYNAAPYHLGLLYETGYGDDVFQDEVYAAQLFTQAADLGHSEASYRLGDAYEHGRLGCPRDPALSVHFYTGAAQRGHPAAMMALCAWYMVGAEPVLEKDENEAFEWARQAAECGIYPPLQPPPQLFQTRV